MKSKNKAIGEVYLKVLKIKEDVINLECLPESISRNFMLMENLIKLGVLSEQMCLIETNWRKTNNVQR